MRLLDDSAAVVWCRDRGLEVSGTGSARRITVANRATSLRFSTEGSAARRVLLAHFLVGALGQEETPFDGGLLWLSRWDIGSDVTEAPGIYLARAMWAPASDSDPILPRPQLFDTDDFVAAQAAVALPLLFEWDAHYVPSSGIFAARLSHDGFVDVFSQRQAVVEEMKRRCAAADVALPSA
jgi:hypothetical protein